MHLTEPVLSVEGCAVRVFAVRMALTLAFMEVEGFLILNEAASDTKMDIVHISRHLLGILIGGGGSGGFAAGHFR